ncbi:MAG: type II CRISPR-associated endonuclease Cas1 [Blautia sp.]
MSWRTVVISSSAKLDYQMGYLVVRKENTSKIHISEIGMLIVESTAVSITAALLCELVKKKVKIIFCDEKRNPCSELLPHYGSHDTSAKIKQQINWNMDMKTAIWTEIVHEKIYQQAEHLKKRRRPEASLLESYLSEIEFGDCTNREGHAAKVYFNALFGKDFTRTADNSLNAALNYGYGIILSCFTREIAANGYLTQLGLFHDNMFNQFNLASDLMEPFRPIVDQTVLEICPQKFEQEEKIAMLRILEQEVVIGGRKEMVGNAIKIFCKSVFDALNDMDIAKIKFYRNEL